MGEAWRNDRFDVWPAVARALGFGPDDPNDAGRIIARVEIVRAVEQVEVPPGICPLCGGVGEIFLPMTPFQPADTALCGECCGTGVPQPDLWPNDELPEDIPCGDNP